ncbi:hypothetical protein LuPra_01359 [Luteitalea pratensis]|uniref:Uncharacterized protein n=1 Tax=Luteitalea pratensis TaxID=1855912 RepID=A0A143PHY8_LUTPR|nr:hypothetical protein LuPra_01359 [Luteitalea pratensis]
MRAKAHSTEDWHFNVRKSCNESLLRLHLWGVTGEIMTSATRCGN